MSSVKVSPGAGSFQTAPKKSVDSRQQWVYLGDMNKTPKTPRTVNVTGNAARQLEALKASHKRVAKAVEEYISTKLPMESRKNGKAKGETPMGTLYDFRPVKTVRVLVAFDGYEWTVVGFGLRQAKTLAKKEWNAA